MSHKYKALRLARLSVRARFAPKAEIFRSSPKQHLRPASSASDWRAAQGKKRPGVIFYLLIIYSILLVFNGASRHRIKAQASQPQMQLLLLAVEPDLAVFAAGFRPGGACALRVWPSQGTTAEAWTIRKCTKTAASMVKKEMARTREASMASGQSSSHASSFPEQTTSVCLSSILASCLSFTCCGSSVMGRGKGRDGHHPGKGGKPNGLAVR